MEKMQHFSIRKLSIGAASVLIGISFLGVKASTVKADSLQNASKTELTKSKAANEVIKQDADSDIKQEPTYYIKKEPVSKTDAKQITSDQPNTDQTPVKPASQSQIQISKMRQILKLNRKHLTKLSFNLIARLLQTRPANLK